MAKSFIDTLRKKIGSSSFTDSKYSEPSHFIDTGSYSLNRVITGDINKGIPGGRSIMIGGPSGCGKSLLALNIAKNALLKNNYSNIIYFDSEGGAPKSMAENIGVDPDLLEHSLIKNCEDATVQVLRTYDAIEEAQKTDPSLRVLLILDSIGMLQPSKVVEDAVTKNDQKFDQGARAKLIRALVASSTIPALKTDCGIIFLNHTYDGPEMHPTKIKNMGGGASAMYASTITLQCSKLLVKPEKKSDGESFYDGSLLKIFSVKNRICRPFFEGEIFIDFKKGITNKYHGLWDSAVKYGLIQMSGAWCSIPAYSDKKMYPSQAMANEDVWKTIIDEFNKKSIEDMTYSKMSEVEGLIQEFEEQNGITEEDKGE